MEQLKAQVMENTERIKTTEEMFDAIMESVDQLKTIQIKNGGGRQITFHRNEFFQMLYDRKNVWKNIIKPTIIEIMFVIGFVGLVLDKVFNLF